MDRFALVVEDDERMARALKSLFTTLGDRHEVVGSLEAARTRLKTGGIDYVLLDMKIPADSDGDFPDMENGMTVLREIRANPATANMPVFPMTSYVAEGFRLSKELHDLGVLACLPKPFESPAQVAATINEALETPASPPPVAKSSRRCEPFSSATREMIIHEDRILLCGVAVWTDRAQQDVRDALTILSRKDKDGFIRMKGPQLDAELGRNASNPISGLLHDFRTNATAVLKREKDLDCGRFDILDSKAGGYHFRQWMQVSVVGDWAVQLGLLAKTDAVVEEKPPVNPRQQWVLDQIDAGRQISQKDVLAHFSRECNASTVKRDLKGLREAGLIETGEQGCYVRGEQ